MTKKLALILCVLLIACAAWADTNPYKLGIVGTTATSDSCASDATILGESTSDNTQGVDYRAITSKYTAACSGSVASIVFRAQSLAGDVKVGIYTDSGTEPDSLVANSAAEFTGQSQAAEGDVTLSYTGAKPSLTKNTVYWVVIQVDETYWDFFADGTSGGSLIRYTKTYADSMPSDWDAQGYTSYTYTNRFDLRVRLVAE